MMVMHHRHQRGHHRADPVNSLAGAKRKKSGQTIGKRRFPVWLSGPDFNGSEQVAQRRPAMRAPAGC